jgi:hypothetical protein
MKMLPTTRAAQLAQTETTAVEWLIEGVWSTEAVGIIGGEPKGKSFLALENEWSWPCGVLPCATKRHSALQFIRTLVAPFASFPSMLCPIP